MVIKLSSTELEINARLAIGIFSKIYSLHTTVINSYRNLNEGRWVVAYVEINKLLINSGINIYDSKRKNFLNFVLPFSVIKVNEELNKNLT